MRDGYVYTVAVQVAAGAGKPQHGGGGGSYDIALYAGGVRLDGRAGTIDAGNVWQTVTFEYRPAGSYVNQPIELRLGGTSGTVFFDAVELSYAAVPEPVSAILTGTAAAVLVFVAARRRRSRSVR